MQPPSLLIQPDPTLPEGSFIVLCPVAEPRFLKSHLLQKNLLATPLFVLFLLGQSRYVLFLLGTALFFIFVVHEL